MTTRIRKTWRNILLMSAAAATLGTLAWLANDTSSQDSSGVTLLNADLQINAVKIRRGEQEFSLRRANGTWQVKSDAEYFPGDEQQIRQLLRALHAPVGPSYPASEFDLAEVRLDPPMAQLEINGNILLELGDYTGIDQQRYVRRDDTVYLVNPLLGYYVEQPPAFYTSDADNPQETPARN